MAAVFALLDQHSSRLESQYFINMEIKEKTNKVLSTSEEYRDAYLYGMERRAQSKSTLDRLLADDWSLITAGCGGRIDKVRHLKDVEDGSLRVEAIDDSGVECRLYGGNAAVVTGQRKSKVTYRERDVSDLTRFSQFYVLQEGQWRCVSTQVTSAATEAERRLMGISRDYIEAYLTCKPSTLDHILVDDWMLMTADGDVVHKAGQLKDLEDRSLQVEDVQDSEVRCRVYGDAGVVTGRRQSKVSFRGRDVSKLTRFSQFYAMRHGEWRCVSTQVTKI